MDKLRSEWIKQLIHQSKTRTSFDYFGEKVSIVNVERYEQCGTGDYVYTFWISNGEAFKLKVSSDIARAL